MSAVTTPATSRRFILQDRKYIVDVPALHPDRQRSDASGAGHDAVDQRQGIHLEHLRGAGFCGRSLRTTNGEMPMKMGISAPSRA
jgi:hypothetical protein